MGVELGTSVQVYPNTSSAISPAMALLSFMESQPTSAKTISPFSSSAASAGENVTAIPKSIIGISKMDFFI